MREICSEILHNRTLTSLNLSGKFFLISKNLFSKILFKLGIEISSSKWEYINDVIKNQTNIKEINLNSKTTIILFIISNLYKYLDCKLNLERFEELANILEYLKSLEKLDVSSNLFIYLFLKELIEIFF